MAAIIPISDRRARLALVLALLGLLSMGITIPAAVWFGIGALKQRQLSSGGEPAMGFLALVVSALDLLVVQRGLARLFETVPAEEAWAGVGWAVILAGAVILLARYALRIHPERFGALLVARTALVASTAGGLALFARLLSVIHS